MENNIRVFVVVSLPGWWSTLSAVSVRMDINMLGDLDEGLGDLDYSLLIQQIVESGLWL